MSIEIGAEVPVARKDAGYSKYPEIVEATEAAIDHPGEWVAAALPPDSTSAGVISIARNRMSREVGEVKIRDGRVYVMFYER